MERRRRRGDAFAGGLEAVRADQGRSQRERPRIRSPWRVYRLSKSSGRSSGTATERGLDAAKRRRSPAIRGASPALRRAAERLSRSLWTDKRDMDSTHCMLNVVKALRRRAGSIQRF